MAFHPRSDTLVLAAADKGGHVGLWHIDRDACGDDVWGQPSAAVPGPGRRRGSAAAAGARSWTAWGSVLAAAVKPGVECDIEARCNESLLQVVVD